MTRLEERAVESEAVQVVDQRPLADARPDRFDERWLARQRADRADHERAPRSRTAVVLFAVFLLAAFLIWLAFVR